MSVGHGQWVLKYNCKAGKCDKCSCAKASQKCNSRCHGGYENNKCLNKILEFFKKYSIICQWRFKKCQNLFRQTVSCKKILIRYSA